MIVDNDLRAEWASIAVSEFSDVSGARNDDASGQIGDLLASVMHLCGREKLSFAKLLTTAQMNYEAEAAEEADE